MAQQWDMASYYSVSIAAPARFASAVGLHFLWDDFTVRYDQNSIPLPADVVTANLIAQERTTQYFAHIYGDTVGFMRQTYAGALPFTTGPQVDGVKWYQDYADQDWHGWKTEIVRGPYPPWPDVWTGKY